MHLLKENSTIIEPWHKDGPGPSQSMFTAGSFTEESAGLYPGGCRGRLGRTEKYHNVLFLAL